VTSLLARGSHPGSGETCSGGRAGGLSHLVVAAARYERVTAAVTRTTNAVIERSVRCHHPRLVLQGRVAVLGPCSALATIALPAGVLSTDAGLIGCGWAVRNDWQTVGVDAGHDRAPPKSRIPLGDGERTVRALNALAVHAGESERYGQPRQPARRGPGPACRRPESGQLGHRGPQAARHRGPRRGGQHQRRRPPGGGRDPGASGSCGARPTGSAWKGRP
jgi:hypothetical protein